MSTVAAWMIYCGAISAVLAAGALAWEQSARWSGRPARWGWVVALGASVTLPWLLRLVPREGWPGALPAPLPGLPSAPVLLDAIGPASAVATGPGWGITGAALACWLVLTVLALAYLGWALGSVAVARRGWRAADLDGDRVYVSGSTGPAALGLRRGLVVVPSWALELTEDLRSLLLAHEREHVRAGDPRVLFGGLLCVALMPWNPLLWLQLLRLRNAIELDCDARVLRQGVNPRAYGRLLLEVGQRRSSSALVMATFAEPRVFLEERIRRIAKWPLQRRRGRAAAAALAALVLFATALSARGPVAADVTAVPEPASHEVPETAVRDVVMAPFVSDTPPAAGSRRIEDGPVFTPMTVRPALRNASEVQRALVRHYPPMLRDAGIGGTVVVWFRLDENGNVAATQLSRSSGYAALDEAGMLVAPVMQFSPAFNREQRVPVWVEIPIVFMAATGGDAPTRQPLVREPPSADPSAPRPMGTPVGTPVQAPPAPPATAEEMERLARAPTFTPMTVRPELRNVEEVQRALVRNYPPLLRDAGIGGSPSIWFFIDRDGNVVQTRISRESGHPALDQAALAVAASMRFSPAMNRDEPVAVWVEIPIVFTAR